MGAGFEAYLNSLQQRRQMEAETFARKKAEKAYMISSIANAGAEVVNAFAQNKQANDYAKRAYVELGMPGADKVKTATDIKAEKVLAKISAIRSGLSQPFNELDANIASYNKELNDLNRQLAELDDYKRTPEYMQERIDTGFKTFVGGNEYNKQRLLNAYESAQEEARYQKGRARRVSEAREIAGFKATTTKNTPEDIGTNLKSMISEYKTIEADLTMDEAEKYDALKKLHDGMVQLSKTPNIQPSDRALISMIPSEPKKPSEESKPAKKEGYFSKKKREEQEALNRLTNKYSQ